MTSANLPDRRVLVTGASGFIGSHLVRLLAAAGAEVHALASTTSSGFPPRLLELRDRLTLHRADLGDRAATDALAKEVRPNTVFHLAAYSHGSNSWQRVDETVQTNIQGTLNILASLESVDYDRFVYCSTGEVYGDIPVPFREGDHVNPASPYAVSKYAAERYCQMFHEVRGWPIVCARPFNAYGPAQTPDRVVPEIIVRGLRGQELKMTSGRQTRDFIYVQDVADGLLRIGTVAGLEGEVINLGTGVETSMREVATMILGIMGDPIEPVFGALPERPTGISRMRCDPSKAGAMLGWEPRLTLRAGLERTVAWYASELSRD